MIDNLLKDKKLLLVCGSGGVGKTTLAASLALKGASQGKKVIVLTIDPAKRLATSLGLDSLSHKPKRINAKALASITKSQNPHCEAMMLDTKSTFDQIVVKYSPNKNIEKKILNNKIYKQLSGMIAGSQEYMAMEKLFELSTDDKYDLIIIDTPPTTHAIDFLEAPQKMIDALSHSMIHVLLKPAMLMGKSGLKLFEKGTQVILKIFDRITGFAFLQDISEMLISFQSLLGGFKDRAEEVKGILTREDTAFVMVAACEEKSVQETQLFQTRLSESNLPLAGVILNRVHPFYELSKSQKEKDEAQLTTKFGAELALKMRECLEQYAPIAKRDLKHQNALESGLKPEQFLQTVPLFETDIHSLEGLWALSQYL